MSHCTDCALIHLGTAKGNSRTGGARDLVSVPCAPLDWFVDELPAPDLVKIDVEGAELVVLENGGRVLRDVRPLMIVETAPENAAAMAALLQRHEYLMFDVEGELDRARERPAWNKLAVPAERRQAVIDYRRRQDQH